MSDIINFTEKHFEANKKEAEARLVALTETISGYVKKLALFALYTVVDTVDELTHNCYMTDIMMQTRQIVLNYIIYMDNGNRKENLVKFNADILEKIYDTVDVYAKHNTKG